MRILFVWPYKDRFGFKPIGISVLSAIAKRLGWESKLFDTTEIDFGYADNVETGESMNIYKPIDFTPYNINKKKIDLREYFSDTFNDFKPDCLAFSVLSDEHLIASDIVKIARQLDPDIPIIWGSKYATLNPEKVLMDYNVDYVCIGEGLDAFPEWLSRISEDGDMKSIKNIWVKDKDKIIKNELRPFHKDLDDLPYLDWEIFDKRHSYKPFDGRVYIGGDHMLNWGCPNSCTYCLNKYYRDLYSKNGHPFRMRRYSIKRIIDELSLLKDKYKIEFFKFHDEDFLMRPMKNFIELSKEYKENVNIPFTIMSNSKSVTEEKVKLLKNMNCVSISIGIETGDNSIRINILNRTDTKDEIIRAFKLFKKYDIRTSSFNMLAIPFETRETFFETIKLNREAEVQYPNSAFFYPFEGTQLREVSIKGGLFKPDSIDKDVVYERDKPALHFENLTTDELIEMRSTINLYIKLPQIYEKYIERSEKRDNIGLKLRKVLIEIYNNTVWKNDGWFIDDGNQETYLDRLSKISIQSA